MNDASSHAMASTVPSAIPQNDQTHFSKRWLLTRWSLVISQPLGACCAIFAIIVLLGYFGRVEIFYRPIAGGPATNPLTALCILCVATGLWYGNSGRKQILQLTCAIAGIILSATKLIDLNFATAFSSTLTPFMDIVQDDLNAGKSNATGLNSAIMLFLLSASLVISAFKKAILIQFLAFISLAVPLVSYTGYAYGFNHFYGQMSLLTATAGIFLALSTLCTTGNKGILRAILSPYVGGRIARVQIMLGFIVPFSMGYLLIKTFLKTGDGNLFGVFVVAITWFIISLVCASAVMQEIVDHKRRHAEKSLLLSAMTDPLTGLFNRRKFYDTAHREFERVRRNDSQFGILILDLDFFKTINDNAGHDMGDKVLKQVARILKQSIRSVDLVARMGGEEFAILLVDTPFQGVERVAEKIRTNVEAMEVEGWTDIYQEVTASIGCANSNQCSRLEEIITLADEALYTAKAKGRNQVCLAKQ
jgi:diguanylate cyclase (GGDEF)-like protein